jgi:hypothetical protein
VAQEIPGDQGQFDVPGLQSGTDQCFQLSAVRGDAISARTAPACLTMPTIALPGDVAVPTNVAAVLADGGKARITWVDPTGGSASHVIRRGETVLEEIPAPTTEAIEDVLADERCFTVQAHVGDQFSEQSEPVCVGDDTNGGPGGPRGPITGATSLGIVALPVSPGFGPASVDDPGGRTIAESNRVDLFNLGFENAVLIVSTDYPQLQPSLANASYLAVIPFFETPQQALDACAQAQLQCQTYAPGPLREGGPAPVSGPPA